jgi:hypothetical protein
MNSTHQAKFYITCLDDPVELNEPGNVVRIPFTDNWETGCLQHDVEWAGSWMYSHQCLIDHIVHNHPELTAKLLAKFGGIE